LVFIIILVDMLIIIDYHHGEPSSMERQMKNILSMQQQKDDFDRQANNYICWFRKANALRLSANILLRQYLECFKSLKELKCTKAPASLFIHEQALLLEGFALECALKGIYIADGGIIAKDGKIIKVVSNQHNLSSWCVKTKTQLSDREKVIIKTLSLIITSYGRYPVPVSFSKNQRIRTKEYGYKPLYMWHHDDFVFVDSLITSLIGEELS